MAHIVTLNTPSREDWLTQLANVVTSPDELLRLLNVDADEKLLAGREARRLFPLRVPRAFIARMEKGNPNDPLLRQVLTAEEEFIVAPGYSTDPLEEQHSVVPGLLHKYRNRALLLVKGGCAVNCRYCFRRHFPYAENQGTRRNWQTAMDYIAAHPQLDEILALCRRAGVTVNLTTNGTLLAQKLPILLAQTPHQMNVSLHSADDNDCIDMDTYIAQLFASCETLLAQTDTEISLRLWNTTGVPTLFGEKNCVIKRHLYVNVQSPFEWPALDNAYCNDRGFCQGLRQHMAVLSDGTVVPCCLDGNAVMALGNIFTTPLKDILAGERSVRFIEGFRAKRAIEPLCRHCSFKERFSHKM